MSLKKEQLTIDIFSVTTSIQIEFPELYLYLTETPLFLSYEKNDIQLCDYEGYLESLQAQLSMKSERKAKTL